MIGIAKETVALTFPVKIVSFLLTLYIASVIIFKENYIGTTHVFNILLLTSYLFLLFMKRDRMFKINSVVIAFALFVLLAFASSLWALDFDLASTKGMQLFLILINALMIYDVMSKYHSVHNAFMMGIFLGSFVNYLFLLGLVQAPFDIADQGRAMGTTGNANVLALVMVMSILSSIIYLYKERTTATNRLFTYYMYLNIFLAIYMIMLTVSKKGILFGGILVVVYLLLSIKDSRTLFRIGVVGMIAIGAFLYTFDLEALLNNVIHISGRFEAFGTELQGDRTGSTAERLRFIELGLNHFKDAPFLGLGIDNFRVYSFTYSHNNFIEVLFGIGTVGLLLFYAMYLFALRLIFQIKEIHLKLILLLTVFNLLLVDMARVSYDDKFTIYMVLFIAVLAEQNSRYRVDDGSR